MPEPDALTARELAAYEKRLAEELSEQEQTAMQERDPVAYKEWLDAEQRHVPMPSRQKPAIRRSLHTEAPTRAAMYSPTKFPAT